MARTTYLSRSVPYGLKSLSGGLNSTDNPLFLQDNEASSLQNIDFDTNGAFKKRNGYVQLNTSAFNSGATWTSLHYFETASTDFLIGTCGNKLAKMDDLDGIWDDITGALTVTAGNGNLFSWRTFNGKAYGTNNIDLPLKWAGSGNGSAWTMPTNVTKAKWNEVFENYMFIANIEISGTRQETRIYWSALNDAETWTATDFNSIGLNDGQEISGLKTLGDRLVIFKERSIHIATFTGDADIPFVFQKTASTVGCLSGYSIQEIKNGLIFLSQDGIYFFDGWNSEKVSDRISITLQGFSQNRYSVASSAFQREKNRYWLAFTTSGGSTHDRVITWDSFNNAFSLYKGYNPNCFSVFNLSGAERIYFGDYSGFVYRADNSSNDTPSGTSTAIDAYWYSKWFDFGDPANQKAAPNVTVYFKYSSSMITLSHSYDLNDGDDFTQQFSVAQGGALWDSAVWDISLWAADGGNFSRRDLDGRGRLIRLKFSNDNLSESFQINGIASNIYEETDV